MSIEQPLLSTISFDEAVRTESIPHCQAMCGTPPALGPVGLLLLGQ